MSKRGLTIIFILVFALLLVSFAFAQEDTTTDDETGTTTDIIDNTQADQTATEKAQQCLMDKVKENCSELLPDQVSFAILGLGDYKNCKEALIDNSRVHVDNQRCWPKSGCKLKDTSIALLALSQLGEDISEAENWLLNQTKIASDLEWYLEITPDSAADCTISYGTTSETIKVLEDDSLSGTLTRCLSISTESSRFPGNLIKISSDIDCLNKKYEISCNQNFKTNLVYFSQNSPAIHVSQKIHAESADGTTTEQITYKCFKQGKDCNYEGSLWATMVLEYTSSGMSSPFIPYLEAELDENLELFPEAFLYKSNLEDYHQPIISQFNNQYWGTGANRFFKTALALFALNEGDEEFNEAKNYLIGDGIQGTDGCWGNMIDTSFLLYTGWNVQTPIDSGNGGDDISYCTNNGYFCENYDDCINNGGKELEDYTCNFGICCDTDVETPSCSEQQGNLCSFGEQCPYGKELASFETEQTGIACCEVECIESETENGCELEGGECKFSCDDDIEEEDYDYLCDTYDDVCCMPKQTPDIECEENSDCGKGEICKDNQCEEKKSRWWIWLLILLIILVIIAIIFRDKIRLMIFKKKAGVKKGPGPKPTRPPTFPPKPSPTGFPARPALRQPRPVFQQPARKPIPKSSVKDKEFEDTLKKLKEMSR